MKVISSSTSLLCCTLQRMLDLWDHPTSSFGLELPRYLPTPKKSKTKAYLLIHTPSMLAKSGKTWWPWSCSTRRDEIDTINFTVLREHVSETRGVHVWRDAANITDPSPATVFNRHTLAFLLLPSIFFLRFLHLVFGFDFMSTAFVPLTIDGFVELSLLLASFLL